MYKTKITEEKKASVQYLKDSFTGVNDFIFTDYRGLTVAQITTLRTKLRELGADYHVIKNRYAKIAFKEMDISVLGEFLLGPTAVALAREESGTVAKELFGFVKDSSLSIKGALVDGKLLNPGEVEAFSKLPTRAELIAKLMGTMNAPLQNLTYALDAIGTKLVRTLQAVADQKG